VTSKGFTLLDVLASTVIVAGLVGAVSFYMRPERSHCGPFFQTLTDMNQLATGCQLYALDFSDSLPGKNWMDATLPYVRSHHPYHSAFVSPTSYGYAFSDTLVHEQISRFSDVQQATIPNQWCSTLPIFIGTR
jgi:hypothetical protein